MDLRIETRAYLQIVCKIDYPVEIVVEALARKIDARAGDTLLSMVEERRHGCVRAEKIRIDVVEYQDRRLPTRLNRKPCHIFDCGMADGLADLGGTGERNLVDEGMTDQRRTHIKSCAGDNIHSACGKADLFDQRRKIERRERRVLGGFQDDSAAASQCGHNLPESHQMREIPRNDSRHDTDGFATCVGVKLHPNRFAERQVER